LDNFIGAFSSEFNQLRTAGYWPLVQTALQAIFFLALLRFLWLLFYFRKAAALRHLPKPKPAFNGVFVTLAILFAAILLHQATWQLTGAFRPDFVTFMQRHDRRQFNPAHRIQRGRILDRRGHVLAVSEEKNGEVQRRYPYGPAFVHVVGYSHPQFGATGLEGAANVQLNGGALDSLAGWGELGRQLLAPDKRPKGQDLILTLDAELQLAAYDRLKQYHAALVLLRTHDGAILALVSTPSYDPNQLSAGLFQAAGPSAPLLNRATQGLYPPGSTFKIVTAALGLNQGFQGTIHCPADGFTTSRYNRKIRDHAYYQAQRAGRSWVGYGHIDLATAFAKSSNVFFAQLGVRYGHQAFFATLDQMYFNNTLILYKNPHGRWAVETSQAARLKDSDRYGLAQMTIGQGKISATPLHMTLITAAVANGGVAPKPRLVQSDPPVALARFMPEATARRLASLMRQVVTEGTARNIDDPTLPIAGKTGTAENPHGLAHSWFVGFAPVARPVLAVGVIIEGGGYGAKTAAPIARDLLHQAKTLGLLP